MRMRSRLSVTTILIGATVMACSKPPSSGRREIPAIIVVPPESRLTFRLEQPLEIEIDEPYPIPDPNRPAQSGPRKLGEHPAAVGTAPESKIDVSGEWNILLEDHRGRRTVRLWLKQDESMLEGTILDPTAGDLRLHGSVTGRALRFSIESDAQGTIERWEYSGAIWGNRLAGTAVVRIRPKPIAPKFEGVPKISAFERTCKWSAQRVKE